MEGVLGVNYEAASAPYGIGSHALHVDDSWVFRIDSSP